MTVSDGKTCRPSGTCAIPRCGRRAGGIESRSIPSNLIEPAMGVRVPEIVLKRVVLPAPFGPTIETNSPSPTLRLTPFSTGTPEYPAVMFSTSSMGHPLFAEIGLDDAWVLDDSLWWPFDEHRAMIEHYETVGHAHHGLHRVLNDDDRHALRCQLADHTDDRLGFRMAKAGQCLIEQKNARLSGKCARELHQTQLDGRQLAGNPVGDCGQADTL